MLRIFLFFVFISVMVSCNREKTPILKPSPIGVKKEYADLIAKPKVVEKEEVDVKQSAPRTFKNQKPKTLVEPSINNTVDTLQFVYARTSKTITKSARQTNIFVVNTDTANKLEIELLANDSANVQIQTITSAVGIKAGPFGKKVEYVLPSKGFYKILVAENPQNAKPYSGEYEIKMRLKW